MAKRKPIDYDEARKRICLAFCKGMINRYGPRKMVKKEIEIDKPGRIYWEKGPIVVDQKNGRTKRKPGKLKRKPSMKVKQEVEIPQGVVPEEMLMMAEGMADAFIEVLKIANESGIVMMSDVVEAGVEGMGN